jgi:HlyD family secretion protein
VQKRDETGRPDERSDSADDVAATLGKHRRSKRTTRIVVAVATVIVATAAFLLWQQMRVAAPEVEYETTTVDRGSIETTAVATGNLEPQRVVDVGAEISGQIATVEVDVNDPVERGQVIATFELESLENALAQARAQVSAARADVNRSESALELARLTRDRLKGLAKSSYIAQREYDEARISVARAEADLAASRAQLRLARTRLELAETNLAKAVIRSPINGVVLTRSIEPGNTVASSFQAPVLFTIAEDLDRMELQVAIDEADVGAVEPGDPATFTVDAWPGRQFEADVKSVYLSPTVTNAVVTYKTLLDVDNSERLLRPGMTATATIVTGRKEDVVRVPNLALGFTPTVAQKGEDQESGRALFGRPPGWRRDQTNRSSRRSVWVLRDGAPTEVSIATGSTDGRWTEMVEGELEAGDELIVGEERPRKKGLQS